MNQRSSACWWDDCTLVLTPGGASPCPYKNIATGFAWSRLFTPPTPRGSSHRYHSKRFRKKAVCKLLKTQGDFAHRVHLATKEEAWNQSGRCLIFRRILIPWNLHDV